MRTAKLTKSIVERQQPNSTIWDQAVSGFGSRRQRDGVYYILRYRFAGVQRQISIGRHGSPWTVDQARREAQKVLGVIVGGSDPLDKTSSSEYFGNCVQQYLERKRASLKPGSLKAITHHLVEHGKFFHGKKIGEIDRRAIAIRLAEIETSISPVARNRVRASLSAFFNWARREGFIESNPVEGTGRADEGGSRDRVLSKAELAKLWTTLAAGLHVDLLDVVHLLMLTGQRKEEIAGLRWAEIDLDARVIRLPAARVKNKREHIVPLSDPALAILRLRFLDPGPLADDRVFRTFGWSREKKRFDAALKIDPWRIHDIRRSVATWLAELGIAQPHIIEAILNHRSGHKGGVAGVYNRARYEKECSEALDKWAAWLCAEGGVQLDGVVRLT
jgi:integrase